MVDGRRHARSIRFAMNSEFATNVSTRVAGGRGLGTILTGPALESIKAGNAYYGKAPVLGTPYIGGYEPIKDASGAIIGVYFVGYKK